MLTCMLAFWTTSAQSVLPQTFADRNILTPGWMDERFPLTLVNLTSPLALPFVALRKEELS